MLKNTFLLVLLIVSCNLANAAITAQQAYVREMPPGQPVTAAFMQLHNDGAEPVLLLGATSDSSEGVEIHAHRHNAGMMSMEKVNSVSLPAGADFVFKPGGYHLMLINLTRPLKEGDSVRLQLQFDHADTVTIDVPVKNIMREHEHH